MSKKATMSSRAVSKALAQSNKAAEEAKLASQAARLAKDAINAAVAASCAAERASLERGANGAKDTTSVKEVAKEVRAAAEEAVERAKEAMKAESAGDATGATYAANLSARAAQRAASLSSAISILVNMAKELASGKKQADPEVTVAEPREGVDKQASLNKALVDAIDRSARFLVTYNGKIIATFLREEDAFLLESELADLDTTRGAATGTCAVMTPTAKARAYSRIH